MATFLSVAPINIIQKMDEVDRENRSKRYLLLAHDVVKAENRHHYNAIFGGHRNTLDHIIMDNSAYELKAAVDTEMVWDAVAVCRPTCVVMPDFYLEGKRTLDAVRDVYEDWLKRRLAFHQRYNHWVQFMVLPQGSSMNEWVWCCEQLAKLPKIEYWGIPRNVRDHLASSRRFAIQVASAFDSAKRIHLFGFTDDYLDDMLCARCSEKVVSIDSTTPVRAGSLGIDFEVAPGQMDLPKRGDWWDTASWNPKILENLAYARKVF
jgi:hypothetical protein